MSLYVPVNVSVKEYEYKTSIDIQIDTHDNFLSEAQEQDLAYYPSMISISLHILYTV